MTEMTRGHSSLPGPSSPVVNGNEPNIDASDTRVHLKLPSLHALHAVLDILRVHKSELRSRAV